MNYALFVDYENIYKEVCNQLTDGGGDSHDAALFIVERTVRMLSDEGAHVLLARAYADWENLAGHGAQSNLALMSVKPEYVLGKRGKSSADLELSLSALEVLLTRDDIEGFVILGGDRDYIPVVARIRESGRKVRVVGFSRSTSGDLIGLVGPNNFTDATRYLKNSFMGNMGYGMRGGSLDGQGLGAGEANTASASGGIAAGAALPAPSEDDLDKCLKLIRQAEARVGKEIWLGPFFKNYMNDVFAALNNAQRKGIIQTLRERGLIRVETRCGSHMGGTYSVLLLNDTTSSEVVLAPGTDGEATREGSGDFAQECIGEDLGDFSGKSLEGDYAFPSLCEAIGESGEYE